MRRVLLLAGVILAVATPALALSPRPPGIFLNPQPLPPRIAPGGAHTLNFALPPHGQSRPCRLANCLR